MSNLSFIFKIVERFVELRFTEHTNQHQLLHARQSAYRSCHSIETVIAPVHDDMINIIDMGHVGALALLDMSSAFDILVEVLRRRFGIQSPALDWFADFVTDRTQSVIVDNATSALWATTCGVPHGPVLGPKQFIAYSEDVDEIFACNTASYISSMLMTCRQSVTAQSATPGTLRQHYMTASLVSTSGARPSAFS